jgi:hypothetical protein
MNGFTNNVKFCVFDSHKKYFVKIFFIGANSFNTSKGFFLIFYSCSPMHLKKAYLSSAGESMQWDLS